MSAFITGQSSQGLRASTIKRRLATLHRFFEFLAVEAGDEVWANPVAWSHHRIRQGTHLPRDLSDETIKRLLDEVAHPRDQAMTSVMLDLGLRVGQVAALEVGDYESASRAGSPARLRVHGKDDGSTELAEVKERLVWLLPDTAAILEGWLRERPQRPDQALFLTRQRTALQRARHPGTSGALRPARWASPYLPPTAPWLSSPSG